MQPIMTYTHLTCGQPTTVPAGAAEQYARDPAYARERFPQSPNYKLGTWCAHCKKYLPAAEYRWQDGAPLVMPDEPIEVQGVTAEEKRVLAEAKEMDFINPNPPAEQG